MHLSVDELRDKVEEFRSSGLNTQQIADELSLSQTTVQWLSASDFEVDDKPVDVKVGWRSIAVKGERIEAISYVFCDIIEEMVGEEIDYANLVAFLSSKRSSYITGTAINLDGGLCPVV